MMLLARPAGMLADAFYRRWMMFVTQVYFDTVSALLAVPTALGMMPPALLLDIRNRHPADVVGTPRHGTVVLQTAASARWSRLLDLTIEASAFVEMVVDARRNVPDYDGTERLMRLVESTMRPAQAAGLASAGLTAADVMLAQRMAYGVVVTAAEPSTVRATVDRALSLAGH